MINVGASITDITPPIGMAMAGFAVRTDPATGTHDPLTARALVVDDTALVTIDVIGIDADLSKRIRARCMLPDEAVTIAATHTHGGPATMSGRLSMFTDPVVLAQLETGIVQAIDTAASNRKPARLLGGNGSEPGFAKNRRQPDGPVDRGIPVLRFEDLEGAQIAILVSYACHPVVLGPDNLTWTGDYPHFVREELEAANPGTVAIFATGCAGDVNTGHSSASSLTNKARPERSFAMAKTIGLGIAQSVADAEVTELSGGVGGGRSHWATLFSIARGRITRESGPKLASEDKRAFRCSRHLGIMGQDQYGQGRGTTRCPVLSTGLVWCENHWVAGRDIRPNSLGHKANLSF